MEKATTLPLPLPLPLFSPVQVFWFFENTHIRFFIRDQSANIPHREYAVELIVKPETRGRKENENKNDYENGSGKEKVKEKEKEKEKRQSTKGIKIKI
jgi:hypothetical protein